VYLHDYPDIEDGIISFRSTGNSFCGELQKLIKAESAACTELRFEVTHQEHYSEKHKKTDYYPKFELVGRNYKLTDDGKVVIDKGSGLDKETLKEILARAKTFQSDYKESRMVSKRSVPELASPPPRKALPGGNAGYEEEDDEENVAF
jgi:hypothetical protein